MSKPLPLTMQGYLVGRDAAQEGDPRLLDDWAERALQSGGWAHVEALLPYAQDLIDLAREAAVNGDGPVFLPYTPVDRAHDAAVLQAAVKGLTERSDGMPQTLQDALVEGWVAFRSDRYRIWMIVEHEPRRARGSWRYYYLGEEGGNAAHWTGRASFFTALSTPFRDLNEYQKASALGVWPPILACIMGDGPEPWDAPPSPERAAQLQAAQAAIGETFGR